MDKAVFINGEYHRRPNGEKGAHLFESADHQTDAAVKNNIMSITVRQTIVRSHTIEERVRVRDNNRRNVARRPTQRDNGERALRGESRAKDGKNEFQAESRRPRRDNGGER